MNDSESNLPADDSPHSGEPVADNAARKRKLQQFVTTIKTAEQQVGENIITALQHDDTVAVLTTVVLAPDGQQQLLTAALDPQMMQQVRDVLRRAEQQREHEEPCIGFHCLVKPRVDAKPKQDGAS